MATPTKYYDAYKFVYPKLIKSLPINNIMPDLIAGGVIPGKLKDRMDSMTFSSDKVKLMLDEMEGGLKVQLPDQFKSLIEVMETYAEVEGDIVVHKLASEIRAHINGCREDIVPIAGAGKYYDAYKSTYSKLIKCLPIDDIMPDLVAGGVLPGKLTYRMDCMTCSSDKVKLMLDEMEGSLKAGIPDWFEMLITVIETYAVDDGHIVLKKLTNDIRATINGGQEATVGKPLKNTRIITKISHQPSGDDDQKKIREDKAYSLALREGQASSSSISIYILGQEKSGKTCLVSSLLGDQFEDNAATQGSDVDVCTVFASKWSRVEKKAMPRKLQNMFHTKLRVTAEIKISAEQHKLLASATNKQELQQTLPELSEPVRADLEKAKAAVLIEDTGINAVIWDFAGQSVYHGLHSMFLKEDNVAMIVFDASQNLHDTTKGRNVLKDPYTDKSINPTTTGAETVCYWLKSIHSICHKDGTKQGSKSRLVPVVILVATHIDAIGNEMAIEERKRHIIDMLFLLLKGKPFAQHLAGIEKGLRHALQNYCFFISNKVRNHNEFKRLKSALADASQYILNQQHPVVYLNIEKNLLTTNRAAMTIYEFHTIANECGFFAAIDSEEFMGALVHFHNKGTILHFPHTPSLQDVVVLLPQWLTKLFAYIVVAHPYKIDASHHDKQFQRLQDHGILVEDFIACMVEKFNKEQKKFGFPITTIQAIDFAQRFGFIAEVNSNTCFLEEKWQPPITKCKVYIVPPMLPWKLPISAAATKIPAHDNETSCFVYFKFPQEYISLMVFYQMLATCIDRNAKRGEDLCQLRRHQIKLVLGSDQYYYVTLSEEQDSILLAITPDEDEAVGITGLQERWNLIEDFRTKLQEISATFMPASDPPECYIPCSKCNNLHLKLNDIRDSKMPLRCNNGKLHSKYYEFLRQYPVRPGDSNKAAKTSGDETLPPELAKKEPNLKKMFQYLKKLTTWETFGVHLLPEDESYVIEQIRKDNEIKGLVSCKWALYNKFLNCGVRTWETVINALKESDNVNIAKEVIKELINDLN